MEVNDQGGALEQIQNCQITVISAVIHDICYALRHDCKLSKPSHLSTYSTGQKCGDSNIFFLPFSERIVLCVILFGQDF